LNLRPVKSSGDAHDDRPMPKTCRVTDGSHKAEDGSGKSISVDPRPASKSSGDAHDDRFVLETCRVNDGSNRSNRKLGGDDHVNLPMLETCKIGDSSSRLTSLDYRPASKSRGDPHEDPCSIPSQKQVQ
jgi:hypothetical protein